MALTPVDRLPSLARFELSARVIVVTGAASGIGRATALVLSGAGATVVAADVDGTGLDGTMALVRTAGGHGIGIPTDVTQASEVEHLLLEAGRQAGEVAGLVNVAGIVDPALIEDATEASFDRVLDVNLRGTFLCCRAAAQTMSTRGRGSIVNVASGIVALPSSGFGCYAMSKGGVSMLSKVLAHEVGGRGIRVNTVAPGFTLTPATMRAVPEGDAAAREQYIEARRAATVLGRCGEPDDVAYAVLYLLSDAASWVTGQTLYVNGGTAMPG